MVTARLCLRGGEEEGGMDARVGGAVGQQTGLPGQLQVAGEWWTVQTCPSSLTPLFLLPLATVHASVRETNFSRP